MDTRKIIISGLDNAGKTSILTAFDKRYGFEKEIMELQPTKKIEYHHTKFLNKSISFWDMGGQATYRKEYQSDPDRYFDNTDLLLYIIDIQDHSRFEASQEYLNALLEYFKKNEMDVPVIVAFHKFDPDLKDDEGIIENAQKLAVDIIKIEQLKKLFIQTSIYNVLSIVQLISLAFSVFDNQHSKLEELFEKYLKDFDCDALILFDANGVILNELYVNPLDPKLHEKLINSIKEHIIKLKKLQEENSEIYSNFDPIDEDILSYLHQIRLKNDTFYLSVVIKKVAKQILLKIFSKFLKELNKVLNPILS